MHRAELMMPILVVVTLSMCAGVVRAAPSQTADLAKAVMVTAGSMAEAAERQAGIMLRWEIRRRTGLDLKEVTALPADDTPAIVVGSRERLPALPAGLALPEPVVKEGQPAAEGYVVMVDTTSRPAPTVCCIGNDRRGTLFAVGRLLREMDWGEKTLAASAGLSVVTAPAYPVRGMQLGYSPTNDTFDGWDISQYAQYIRDLIIFGNNSVELTVESSAVTDPIMPLIPWDMTVALSALLDAYDMDVWMWLPALERGAAADPTLRQQSLRQLEMVFAGCRRIDRVFMETGGPGDTPADVFFTTYLRELAAALHRHHPNAQLWASPARISPESLARFYRYLQQEQPEWIGGVVWGPGCADTLQHTRQMVPAKYPIRQYPDIAHALRCQYPFPYIDEPWAQAYSRQPIQPRPTQYAHICRLTSPYSAGAICYSEGTGGDVNKVIWDALLWDPKADVRDVLRDFGRCFFGPEFADEVADGELMLERNWVGPAATNPQVAQTFAHWQAMEKRATPKQLANWRFQQGLIRAYGDMFIQTRLHRDLGLLDRAYAELKQAPKVGPEAAMTAADKILAEADPLTAAPELRNHIHELGAQLFKSIGMQLSVKEYGATDTGRGAQLDNNDQAVSDCNWLRAQLAEIRNLPTREAQLAAIAQWVNWTDPGPGGFYDDLGNHANLMDSRLVREVTWEEDPEFAFGPNDAHAGPLPAVVPHYRRMSWTNQAQTAARPLRLRYTGLDPNATYVIKATYAGRSRDAYQLFVNGEKLGDPVPMDPLKPAWHEFEVPRSATAGGALDVTWSGVRGGGGEIAEAWLIRK